MIWTNTTPLSQKACKIKINCGFVVLEKYFNKQLWIIHYLLWYWALILHLFQNQPNYSGFHIYELSCESYLKLFIERDILSFMQTYNMKTYLAWNIEVKVKMFNILNALQTTDIFKLHVSIQVNIPVIRSQR